MKEGLGPEAVSRLGRNLRLGDPTFDEAAFVEGALSGLEALELKDRVRHLASVMAAHLHPDFPEAIGGICDSLAQWDRGLASDSLRGFSSWPVFTFVAEYGLDHCDLSLKAIRVMTHLFTGEFAVRAFLLKYQAEALVHVQRWAKDKSPEIRRLASEGVRPRLPWAGRLPMFQSDPTAVLDILEQLKDDSSAYVRRSVANCLADVAVDHPDRVIEVCHGWMCGASEERRWVIKRGTRNLVKSGHPGIWELHGFASDPAVVVENLQVSPGLVGLGQKFEIRFALRSLASTQQALVVDFIVHHVKSSGKTTEKVFKLRQLQLGAGACAEFSKSHTFRKITTRVYYPGTHRIEVQVNGRRHGKAEVQLQI